VAKGKINKACNVLNDIADKRWNGTEVIFTPYSLALIPRERKTVYYTFYHLFNHRRFAKQSFMQLLSIFTYSMVAMTYLYVIRDFSGSSVLVLFLDGAFRLVIPIIIIILDFRFEGFTRRFQFLLALILMGLCFGTVIILLAFGQKSHSTVVTVLVIVGAMINDSVFWMNIVQVTTQRYPTVIRCIAFGCLHSFKHIGTIVGVIVLPPLLESKFPMGAFLIPMGLIIVTLIAGSFLQPDTKGKALLDTIDEIDYTRLENALPRTLYKMAAMHRVMQSELHTKLANENKDKWAEWKEELERREREGTGGRSNLALDFSSDEDGPTLRKFSHSRVD
jgi:hypothetical protein